VIIVDGGERDVVPGIFTIGFYRLYLIIIIIDKLPAFRRQEMQTSITQHTAVIMPNSKPNCQQAPRRPDFRDKPDRVRVMGLEIVDL
jgi:hypothetical protein